VYFITPPVLQPLHVVLWRCWFYGRKGNEPVIIEWWSAGVVISLGWGGDLLMAHLIPLPLIVSCCSKSRLVLTLWYRLTWVVPDKGPLNGYCCYCCYSCCCYITRRYASTVHAIVVCPSVWCGCSILAAEWLDSFAVGIAQRAHTACKSIFCLEVWRCGWSQMTLGRTCCQRWRISRGHRQLLQW